ncbi:MAG: MMPL family transporter, partial [Candidatus Sericytochromatia bacterium]
FMKLFSDSFAKVIYNYQKHITILFVVLFLSSVSVLTLNDKDIPETDTKGLSNTEAAIALDILKKDFNEKSGSSFALVLEKREDVNELSNVLKKQFPSHITLLKEVDSPNPHKSQLILIQMNPTLAFMTIQNFTKELREFINPYFEAKGNKSYITGNPAFRYDGDVAGKQDSARNELIAIIVAFFILIYNFGSFMAAFLPLIIGISSIVFLNMSVLIFQLESNALSKIIGSLVGIALSIDYSLFIVSRFREELKNGKSDFEALSITLNNAGETVLFSALIMFISIAVLYIPDVSTSKDVVINICSVILLSLFSCITFLPAFLLTGKKLLNYPKKLSDFIESHQQYEFWRKYTSFIVSKPKTFFILSLLLLFSLSIPIKNMKVWEAVQNLTPQNTESMIGYKILENDGWGGELLPVILVVKAKDNVYNPEFISFLFDITKELKSYKEVQTVTGLTSLNDKFDKNDYINFYNSLYSTGFSMGSDAIDQLVNTDKGSNLTLMSASPKNVMNLEESYKIIEKIRNYKDKNNKFEVFVTGIIPRAQDFTAELYGYVYTMLGIIFGGIMLLLSFYMKSIMLPIKAALMNFLPIVSAFGILGFVYRNELTRTLLGIAPDTEIITMVPLILFCIVFGLSMDYEVLILSRITENYHRTGDVKESVIEGISRSGSVITGAV